MTGLTVKLFDMVKCFECGVYFFPGEINGHKCKSKEEKLAEDETVVLAPLTIILNRHRKEVK